MDSETNAQESSCKSDVSSNIMSLCQATHAAQDALVEKWTAIAKEACKSAAEQGKDTVFIHQVIDDPDCPYIPNYAKYFIDQQYSANCTNWMLVGFKDDLPMLKAIYGIEALDDVPPAVLDAVCQHLLDDGLYIMGPHDQAAFSWKQYISCDAPAII